MNNESKSPAMRLIAFVRENKMDKCPYSRERADHINGWGMELAVRGGFLFEKGDFGQPVTRINESLYAAAILEGNMSAIQALEYAANRTPFIAMDVLPSTSGRMMAHMAGSRDECRLAVGFRFRWDNKWVTVTSFAEDSSHVVACSYREGGYYSLPTCDKCGQQRYDLRDRTANKPERVYKITVADLRAGRALYRKKHPKCPLCLKPIAEGQEICGDQHNLLPKKIDWADA